MTRWHAEQRRLALEQATVARRRLSETADHELAYRVAVQLLDAVLDILTHHSPDRSGRCRLCRRTRWPHRRAACRVVATLTTALRRP